MLWFRLYTEVKDDPKVQRLPGELFKQWINLLCLAKECGGVLPPVEDIAFKLRLTQARAHSVLQALADKQLLESVPNGYAPHNWNGRQHEWDSAAERMRRYRNRKKSEQQRTPVSDSDAMSDVTVTVQSREEQIQSRTEQNRAEGAFDFEEWFSRLVYRHPKKAGKRQIAAQMLTDYLGSSVHPEAVAADIDAKHQAWCKHWARNGLGYAPKLENWVADQGWLDSPPPPRDKRDSVIDTITDEDLAQ